MLLVGTHFKSFYLSKQSNNLSLRQIKKENNKLSSWILRKTYVAIMSRLFCLELDLYKNLIWKIFKFFRIYSIVFSCKIFDSWTLWRIIILLEVISVRILKTGFQRANKNIKTLLHLAALSAIQNKNSELRKYYERKIAEGRIRCRYWML